MYSMTAFARRTRQSQWGALIWELRSVNHRFLDLSLRLPEEVREMEGAVRQQLSARLNRGKVDCTLRLQYSPDKTGYILNQDLARQLIQSCDEISAMLTQATPPGPLEILRWPGVMQTPEPQIEALQGEALALLDEAVDALVAERRREGGGMREVITQRCRAMQAQLAGVKQRLPEVRDRLRAKLLERLEQLGAEVDTSRLEQELVYWLQKLDVEEELDRAAAHLQEVEQLLGQDTAVGRRLDFLMQELNREANTLGSKSADIETTRASVEMKVLIEQMREQVQNVE